MASRQGCHVIGRDDRETLASEVRERRRAASLTQSELAARAEVSVGTVQNAESGRAVPQAASLERVLAVLDELGAVATPRAESFGAWVARRRAALGLTRSDLAAQVGLHRNALAAIEAGRSEPRDITVASLKRALLDDDDLGDGELAERLRARCEDDDLMWRMAVVQNDIVGPISGKLRATVIRQAREDVAALLAALEQT